MNPGFIVLILFVAIVVIIVVLSETPQGRGFWGERYMRLIIGKTKTGKRYVINNYMIVVDGKSSQIDHILINQNGIFVIETKNYSGRIYGKENQQEWTQVLNYGKVKNTFYNPVKQNVTHIYRLASVLPKEAPLISVVVFTKDNTEYIDSKNVVGASHFGRFVKKPNEISLSAEQMLTFYNHLLENKSDMTAKEHIAEIKQMKADIQADLCPRCGGKLVERRGKYGNFWGCENFPQCKFIKK